MDGTSGCLVFDQGDRGCRKRLDSRKPGNGPSHAPRSTRLEAFAEEHHCEITADQSRMVKQKRPQPADFSAMLRP